MTTTDKLMDTAQELLVNGKSHDETVAALTAGGTDPAVAETIVTATETHPVTKILVGMQS